MKMKFLSITLLASVLMLSSCKKNEPVLKEDIDYSTASSVELSNFINNEMKKRTQYFIIDASNPQVITGNNGVSVQFYANAFEDATGNVVTGNVSISLLEILDKSSMVLTNKPTMGKDWNGEYSPLISGGEFRILASQGGQPLKLRQWNSYYASIPASDGITDPNMTIFYGDTNNNDTLNWTQADSAFLQGDSGVYSGYFDSIGWINCDYFYNDPRPKTFVEMEIPQGLTNQTCLGFIWFDGINSITSFYNFSSNTYTTAPSYKLPIGLNVHFIALSFINGMPHVAIQSSTITNNHREVITALNQTTPTQLATDLANLP